MVPVSWSPLTTTTIILFHRVSQYNNQCISIVYNANRQNVTSSTHSLQPRFFKNLADWNVLQPRWKELRWCRNTIASSLGKPCIASAIYLFKEAVLFLINFTWSIIIKNIVGFRQNCNNGIIKFWMKLFFALCTSKEVDRLNLTLVLLFIKDTDVLLFTK